LRGVLVAALAHVQQQRVEREITPFDRLSLGAQQRGQFLLEHRAVAGLALEKHAVEEAPRGREVLRLFEAPRGLVLEKDAVQRVEHFERNRVAHRERAQAVELGENGLGRTGVDEHLGQEIFVLVDQPFVVRVLVDYVDLHARLLVQIDRVLLRDFFEPPRDRVVVLRVGGVDVLERMVIGSVSPVR
jgi:hypothetical protein